MRFLFGGFSLLVWCMGVYKSLKAAMVYFSAALPSVPYIPLSFLCPTITDIPRYGDKKLCVTCSEKSQRICNYHLLGSYGHAYLQTTTWKMLTKLCATRTFHNVTHFVPNFVINFSCHIFKTCVAKS